MEITIINNENVQSFSHLIPETLVPGQGGLGVIEDQIPVGAALFSVSDGVCVMDAIRVAPKYRRKGIGRLLFERAEEAFFSQGYEEMMAFYEDSEEATSFLESLGFGCAPTLPVYSISINEIIENTKCQALASSLKKERIINIDSMTSRQKNPLIVRMREEGIDHSLLLPDEYDNEISFAYLREGVATGMLLAKRWGEDIYVSALLTTENDIGAVLGLIGALVQELNRYESANGKLSFLGGNEKVADFLNSYLGVNEKLETDGLSCAAICRLKGEKDAEGI